MSNKKILIVEDEILIAENTKSMLQDLGYDVAAHAMNLSSAIEHIEKTPFDIALVDLMLGNKKDGIEVARILNKKKKPFIIVSSYSDKETLSEVKSYGPSGYLVKPIQERDLFATLEIIPTDIEEFKILDGSIFYKDKELLTRINTNDIEYIKSDGNYLEVYTVHQKKHLLRLTFDDILSKLPNNFIRTHRSYVINSNMVQAVNSIYIQINQQQIPLSKTYRDDFLKKITVL